MQRKHKYLWIKGTAWWDYTYDGVLEKPKIKKNEKVQCRKQKRRYFKNLAQKEVQLYDSGAY